MVLICLHFNDLLLIVSFERHRENVIAEGDCGNFVYKVNRGSLELTVTVIFAILKALLDSSAMSFSIFLNLALLGAVLSASANDTILERSALVGDEDPQPRQLSSTCGQRRSKVSSCVVMKTRSSRT